MENWNIIIPAVIAAVFVISGIIVILRARHFRPTKDKAKQLAQLNEDIKPAGFAYERKGDYFYSLHDCWQKDVGYCRLYDEGSPFFNMIMDCEPIPFVYGGKRWLIELWKGQYGITTGAEIGIYNTTRNDIKTEAFTGTFYDTAKENEQMHLSFTLYKNGKVLLKRSGLTWWLTAFRLGEFSKTDTLTMDAKIKFPNRAMCQTFTDALTKVGYLPHEFSVRYRTVTIYFDKPHTLQPVTQEGVQEDVVQKINENNCKLFSTVTAKYSDTLDKLEYVKSFVPELYETIFHSMYAKAFFKTFDWLIDLVYKNQPADDETSQKMKARAAEMIKSTKDSEE